MPDQLTGKRLSGPNSSRLVPNQLTSERNQDGCGSVFTREGPRRFVTRGAWGTFDRYQSVPDQLTRKRVFGPNSRRLVPHQLTSKRNQDGRGSVFAREGPRRFVTRGAWGTFDRCRPSCGPGLVQGNHLILKSYRASYGLVNGFPAPPVFYSIFS